jgi:crotonobetainyl-CoA:carnitine CoA-transferase CaiB-like acyl-CoA transferase
MPDLALDDVQVLDLTHYIAGPYCTKLLADYGAEVMKIERPDGGDPTRRLGPFPHDLPDPEKSGLFLLLNTNKLGITLNVKTGAGVKIFKELVKEVDILVENFAPRVMPGLGLDYETLKKINPRLIMTSISNFGQYGPYRDFKATEIVLAALGGNMYLSGDYDRPPIMHGVPISQYMGGQNAFIATLMALFLQRETGRGQHLDVSLMESVTSSIPYALNQYSYMGAIWRRGPKKKAIFGMDLWPTKDGYAGMSVIRSTNFADVATFLGIPELADPKFATPEGRTEHNAELETLVLNRLVEWEKMTFFCGGHARRFMTSVEQTPTELLHNEQLVARDYYRELEHPRAGSLPYPGEVLGLTETPGQLRKPAPLLGQHNEEVIGQRLGYAKEDLVKLKQIGVT